MSAIREPKGLQPDQRLVYRRLRAIVRDAVAADAAYDRRPEARDGRVISVDLARFLVPEFNSWDGRIRHTPSTGVPAGWYAHDRLRRELQGRRAGLLVITAGGAGLGKTTVLGDWAVESADLVFDNQFRDLARAEAILGLAINHGWSVDVVFVHRPFSDVVRSVIERGVRTGRWNYLRELPSAHLACRRAIVELSKKFCTNPRVSIFGVSNASQVVGNAAKTPFAVSLLESNGFTREHLLPHYAKEVEKAVEEALASRTLTGEFADLFLAPTLGSEQEVRESGT